VIGVVEQAHCSSAVDQSRRKLRAISKKIGLANLISKRKGSASQSVSTARHLKARFRWEHHAQHHLAPARLLGLFAT
jgi:hypothetical protein